MQPLNQVLSGRGRADALPVLGSYNDAASIGAESSLKSNRSLLQYSTLRRFHDRRPDPVHANDDQEKDWRIRDRLKTVSCLLCVCLNIGVDPPDSLVPLKPAPCARLECFVDPFRLNPQKSLPLIGRQLQLQYEQIQPRARYKQALDPTADDLKKALLAMRRSAKDERILFHYNGHGVPRPTASKELWVFNKSYTQYIPVSMHDLQQWIGSPAVYVIDTSSASQLISKQQQNAADNSTENWGADFYLCACRAHETLPLNPDLPADLFTSCLTSPIETSLLYFLLNQKQMLSSDIDYKQYINRIPGRIQDRKTPLGELYWIFTAITDTIAFTTLPLVLFKALFRQDLMVAALFRNFLLAQWILPKYGCNPVSVPSIPTTANHELWTSWEYVLENIILQLPNIITTEPELVDPLSEETSTEKHTSSHTALPDMHIPEYEQSSFFDDQLSTFESWLNTPPHKKTPTHLPVILQVLLSQHFRHRALILLCRFLELGKWAVYHALSVGIFPYVLKLLQSPAMELKFPLVFIWSRIIVFCPDSVADLAKENGYQYFVNIMLTDSEELERSNPEIKSICAFVLTMYAKYDAESLFRTGVHFTLAANLHSDDEALQVWSLLALCELLPKTQENLFIETSSVVVKLLEHESPLLRSAAIYFISQGTKILPTKQNDSLLACGILLMTDACPAVRYEVLCLIHGVFIGESEPDLLREALVYWKFISEPKRDENDVDAVDGVLSFLTLMWRTLLCLSGDPDESISSQAKKLIDHVCFILVPELAPDADKTKIVGAPKMIPIKSIISQTCIDQFGKSVTLSKLKQTETPQFSYSSNIGDLETKRFQHVFDIGAMATNLLKFHPRDNLIAVVDENDALAIWDHKRGKCVSSVKMLKKSSQFSRKTHLEFLNSTETNALLLVGSNDGIVRVYDDVLNEPSELTSWRCLPELLPDETGSGLILHINQLKNIMIASGDVKSIKLWDMRNESLISEFNSHASHGISALTSTTTSDVIYSGDTRGKIRVYDTRANGTFSCVKTWKEHKSWIVDMKLDSSNNLHTISSDGSFKIWDVRMGRVVYEYECDESKKTTAAKFHEHLPQLIVGSSSQVVKVFEFGEGVFQTIETIKNREGIMGSRIAPVTAVAFHSSKDVIAIGGLEQYVTVGNLLKNHR